MWTTRKILDVNHPSTSILCTRNLERLSILRARGVGKIISLGNNSSFKMKRVPHFKSIYIFKLHTLTCECNFNLYSMYVCYSTVCVIRIRRFSIFRLRDTVVLNTVYSTVQYIQVYKYGTVRSIINTSTGITGTSSRSSSSIVYSTPVPYITVCTGDIHFVVKVSTCGEIYL